MIFFFTSKLKERQFAIFIALPANSSVIFLIQFRKKAGLSGDILSKINVHFIWCKKKKIIRKS